MAEQRVFPRDSAPAVDPVDPEDRSPGWLERLRFGRDQQVPRRRAAQGAQPNTAAPTHTSPGRHGRRWKWLIALVVLVLAYPVLGTLALWTGLIARLLSSEDLKVELTHPSYTLWPGFVHVKHARILVNGETQFSLEADNLLVDIQLRKLPWHLVQVTTLSAEHVHYQMRVQVENTKGIEKRLAAYPPLPDLPGKNEINKKKAEKEEPSGQNYTVQVSGLDVSVDELWFFEYRYLGKGRLRGGFVVGPNVMAVTTSVQDLGPGQLRFGATQPVADRFRGQITATIPRTNPNEHADTSFLELVSARANLKADVVSLANVSAYLDNIEVSRGAGPWAIDLFMEKGWLGAKSHMNYDTDSLHIKGNGFGVETDWHLAFDATGERKATEGKAHAAGAWVEVTPEERQSPELTKDVNGVRPLLRSSSNLTYVSFARKARVFTLQLAKHREEAALDRIKLSGESKFERGSVRMPSIVSVDLHDLDVVLPEDSGVDVQAGRAEGSLNLDMDPQYWLRGPLQLGLHGVKLNAAGVGVSTEATLRSRVELNPKLGRERLEDLTLSLRDSSMHAGSKDVQGWWFDLFDGHVELVNGEHPQTQASVRMRAKDLEPVLEALAQKKVITELIPMFTRLGDFRAKASLRKVGTVTDAVIESESDIWDISGRVYQKGEQTQAVVVFGGQAVSLGVAKTAQDGLEIMPFAKTKWLNDHLRELPKPIVQMPKDKP